MFKKIFLTLVFAAIFVVTLVFVSKAEEAALPPLSCPPPKVVEPPSCDDPFQGSFGFDEEEDVAQKTEKQ